MREEQSTVKEPGDAQNKPADTRTHARTVMLNMFLAIIARTYDEAQQTKEGPMAREFRRGVCVCVCACVWVCACLWVWAWVCV